MTAVIVLSLLTASLVALIEISTVMLRLTGMREEVARLQAISLLSRTGFTTLEAEQITRHPRRRSIAMVLMVSSLMAIVVVTSLVHGVIGEEINLAQLTLVSGIAAVMLLVGIRSRPFQRYLGRKIATVHGEPPDPAELQLYEVFPVNGQQVLEHIPVSRSSGLAGKQLAELELSQAGVHVLQVSRNGTVRAAVPDGSLRLQAGDRLLVYGARARIEAFTQQFNGSRNSTP